jgi:hypothetical protein
MALFPQEFLDTVVEIGEKDESSIDDDSYNWVGTGFFLGKPTALGKNEYNVFLVTNKHVIKDLKKIFIRCNPKSKENAIIFEKVLVDNSGILTWSGHPQKDIDVAVIPILYNELRKLDLKESFFLSDKDVKTKNQLIESGVSEGDSIFVFGFPACTAIENEKRKYVIVRSGIIARIKNLLEDFSNDFLIDSHVFPGNSGGPVIITIREEKPLSSDEIAEIYDPSDLYHMVGYLIGMVKGYIPYIEPAYSPQTKKTRMIFEENSALASVIPVDYILETLDDALKLNAK